MSCNESGMGLKRLALQAVDGALAVAVVGVTATVTVQVPGGGYFRYHLWLADSNTSPTVTTNLPSSQIVEWQGNTDSNGLLTLPIVNSDASKSWYLWGYFNFLNVSPIITVGV